MVKNNKDKKNLESFPGVNANEKDTDLSKSETIEKSLENHVEEEKYRERYIEDSVKVKIHQENEKLRERKQNRVEQAEKKGRENHGR